MSNIHRILWIDREVRHGHHPNSRSIAEQFGISTRQAARDIEYMMDSLNAPLIYVPRNRGYKYSDTAYVLPNVYVSQDVSNVLSFLAYRYENLEYGGFESSADARAIKRVASLFRDISNGTSNEVQVPTFTLNPSLIDMVSTLDSAIRAQRKMMVKYLNPNRTTVQYCILPTSLYYRYNVDYLTAFIDEVGDQVFRLDRIIALEPVNWKDYPVSRRDVVINQKHAPTMKPFVAHIEFIDLIPGNVWRGYNVYPTESKDVYYIEFYNVDAFVNDIILDEGWRSILSPSWLREKLMIHSKSILSRLDSSV